MGLWAGPIRRMARITRGGVFLWFLYRFVTHRSEIVHPGNLALYLWALIGIHSHVLGSLIPLLKKNGGDGLFWEWGGGAVILDLLHDGHG